MAKAKTSDKLKIQQLYPEFNNMQRQVEMLRHMAAQTATENTMKRARPYLAGVIRNLLTIIRHINDDEPGTEFAMTLQAVLKHCETTEADFQWLDKEKTKLYVEGGFNVEKLRHFMLLAATPINLENGREG